MSARIITGLFITLVFFVALAGCGGQAPAKPPAAVGVNQEWKSDGNISDGEYSQGQKIGEIEVFTRVEGDSIMMALRAKTAGWLAIGIDPEEKMKGADMIFGFVKDGRAEIFDMYSTGTFGPHPPDDRQGGTADVAMISGSSKDGVLVLEFKRKLSTGDGKDKALKIGENKVIWAIGDVTDATVKHSRRGTGILVIKP